MVKQANKNETFFKNWLEKQKIPKISKIFSKNIQFFF